jgi:hypothetical protein
MEWYDKQTKSQKVRKKLKIVKSLKERKNSSKRTEWFGFKNKEKNELGTRSIFDYKTSDKASYSLVNPIKR